MTAHVAMFVSQCEAVGLRTGMDSRGLVHVILDRTGWRNCQVAGDGHGSAPWPPNADSRVCMHCREVPGRIIKGLPRGSFLQ